MKKALIFPILTFVTFYSCNNDGISPMHQNEDILLDTYAYHQTMTENGQLIYDNMELFHYNFNENGLLESSYINLVTSKFFYFNSELSKIEEYLDSGEKLYETHLQYSNDKIVVTESAESYSSTHEYLLSNGIISRVNYYIDNAGIPSHYEIYTWDNGDIVQRDLWVREGENYENAGSTYFFYDDSFNPEKLVKPNYLPVSLHNVIKETYSNGGMRTFEYVLNEGNYPIKKSSNYQVENSTREYIIEEQFEYR